MRTRSRFTAAVVAAAAVPWLSFPGTAQATVTTVALWHMEDPSAMTDSSGNNNNGTTTDISGVAGYSGQGYGFNGSTSEVTVQDSASLDPGTADFSYTAEVNFTVPPNSTVGDYDLIRKGLAGTAGGDWKMEIDPPTTGSPLAQAFCMIQDANGASVSVRNTRNLADGAWHTITCQKTTTTVSLTVDGMAIVKAASLGSISNNSIVEVGRKLGGGDQYLGSMDEVSIQVGDLTDATPPTTTALSPATNAIGVSTTASVTATFSETVQGLSGSTFTLTPARVGPPVPAAVSYNMNTNVATLKPGAALAGGTQYAATLVGGPTAIRDVSGNPLATTSWSFTTKSVGDATPPTVKTVTPASGTTSVGLATNVTATFSEAVQGVGLTTFTLASAASASPVTATITQSGTTNKWILDPTVNLSPDTVYTATLTGGSTAITDKAGNSLATTSWSFLTGPAPRITFRSPAAGATGVSAGTGVAVTFSEPVLNVTGATLALAGPDATPVLALISQSGSTNKWILQPSTALSPATQYTVTVVGGTGGITDLAGNPLAGTAIWTFTTA